MKKVNTLAILSLAAVLALSGCGSAAQEETAAPTVPETTAAVTEEATEVPVAETAAATEPEKILNFDRTPVLEAGVLLENPRLKVMAKELRYEETQAVLSLDVENLTEDPMRLAVCSRAGALLSVNGNAFEAMLSPFQAEALSSVSYEIPLSYEALLDLGILRISEIRFSLDAEGEKNGIMTAKTDAPPTSFWETVQAPPRELSWTVEFSSDKKGFERSGVKHTGTAVVRLEDGRSLLILDIENTTKKVKILNADEICFNGLKLTSTGEMLTMLPGSHGLLTLDLQEQWEKNGLTALGFTDLQSLSFRANIFDEKLKPILTPAEGKVIFSEEVPSFAPQGPALYESENLAIYAGALIDTDYYEPEGKSLVVIFENRSGKPFLAQAMGLSYGEKDLEFSKHSVTRETDGFALLDLPLDQENAEKLLQDPGSFHLQLLAQVKGSREVRNLEIPNP